MNKCLNLLLIVTLLALSGCSDLFQKKVVKRPLDSSRFRADCDLEIDKFALIMEENISDQIACLGENLHLFIRVVESGRPGYLGRRELEQYIRNNRSDVRPEVVKALKSVFDINYLIFGEDKNFISKQNVDKIIRFAITFNVEAAKNFNAIFKGNQETTFAVHMDQRYRIQDASKTIIAGLNNIFNPNRNGQIHELNIVDLLESFITDQNRSSIEKVKKVLFAKRVILGGNEQIITHQELGRLILNFDSLVVLALDAVRYKHIILKQEYILQLLKMDIDLLSNVIYQTSMGDRTFELFFTLDEAIDAVKMLKPDFDLDKYKDLISEAKQIVMQGSDSSVSGGDFKKLLNHGKSLLNTGTWFHRIYDAVRPAMESPRPVSISYEDLRVQLPQADEADLKNFIRIASKYRFLKGNFLSPYYSLEYHRNPESIFQVSMIEYVIKLIFNKYGCPFVRDVIDGKDLCPTTYGIGGVAMTKNQAVNLATRFQDVLIDLDLILPGNAAKTAETVMLLGSLFQYQSDDNKALDVNEATEFAVSLFTSSDVAKDLMSYYNQKNKEDKNKCDVDKYGRIAPTCFKEHFFPALCKYYRSYFPNLFLSLVPSGKCEDLKYDEQNMAFLEKTVKAARTCHIYPDDHQEIYYTQSDIHTIFIAMMHIETTILRWDVGGGPGNKPNNIMDPDEVMNAYAIYSPALDGFLEKKSAIVKKFKKQIYQYLVKYEEVPDEKEFSSIWKFIKFLISFKKSAPANRKTIAAILSAIGEQGTPSTFNCNYLHDPTSIPRHPEPIEIETEPSSLLGPVSVPDYSSMLEPYLHLGF